MRRKKKILEQKLGQTDTERMSDPELLKFCFNRKSFFRDYKLLHRLDVYSVKTKINGVTCMKDTHRLANEVRICFHAATQMKERHTYYFNFFIIDLIERYYSDVLYQLNREEIKEKDIITNDTTPSISYQWVLRSRILNSYQRYLLFEYLALGYSLEDLGRRRYCTSRTIENHLEIIIKELNQLDQAGL